MRSAFPCQPLDRADRYRQGERNRIFSAKIEDGRPLQQIVISHGFKMQDGKDNIQRQSGRGTHNARKERLKRALRENLKRRKSQARAQDEFTIPSSNSDDVAAADATEKHPGK
jgi:hypothetical protein